MEFNFIVGRYSITNNTENIIAGFTKLETAKKYADLKELDYLSNGYIYIDTPDGRHILGVDRRTTWNKWYAPGERVYVYDAREDCSVSLDDL